MENAQEDVTMETNEKVTDWFIKELTNSTEYSPS
jgi:hypothetical protein